jgi:hypothetical protein
MRVELKSLFAVPTRKIDRCQRRLCRPAGGPFTGLGGGRIEHGRNAHDAEHCHGKAPVGRGSLERSHCVSSGRVPIDSEEKGRVGRQPAAKIRETRESTTSGFCIPFRRKMIRSVFVEEFRRFPASVRISMAGRGMLTGRCAKTLLRDEDRRWLERSGNPAGVRPRPVKAGPHICGP